MFGRKEPKICPICNEKITFLKSAIKDGVKVCSEHVVTEAGLFLTKDIENLTVEELKVKISERQKGIADFQEKINRFTATKQVGNFVAFDDNQEKWAVLSPISGEIEQIYSYNNVVNFELLEDGESIAKGGLGRALVGGALFGGTGAIVGGITGNRKTTGVCDSLKLKITMDNIQNPIIYVNLIKNRTKKDDVFYKTMAQAGQELLSIFQIICDKLNQEMKEQQNKQQNTLVDEMRQLKELLDESLITQEEFNKKRKELLGL